MEGRLDELRGEIVRSVREAGVGFSQRETEGPFRPHMTLARVRSPLRESAIRTFFELDFRASWPVDEVALFQSRMDRGPVGDEAAGARYLKILRIPLVERT